MKVTILSTAYPYRGGIAVFTERLARAFQENQDEVRISTFTLQYPNFLFPGKSQYSSSKRPKNLSITTEVNSINPFNWISVGLRIQKEKPDLLVLKYWIPFMAPCLGTISRIVRKNKHTKVIVIVDNIIPHESRIGDNLLNKYFINSVDGFVAMSSSVMKDLLLFDRKKERILGVHPLYDNFGIPKSKEAALQSLNLSKEFSYILFFGIIRKYKGLDILINALADKNLDKKDLKVIIAGEFYEDASLYHDLIKKHNLEDRIILVTKFIPDEEVANYFCAVDMIVQPYRNATQSGVTQIAYHFEKPMLVTNVGGLEEIVPNKIAGYVCAPDSSEIAEAINDFYINNREKEYIEGVKKEKTKYSWQKMIENIYQLYSDIRDS